MYRQNKNESGFALVLAIVLLLAMSLMGGSLVVISSGDHQSNNNSDEYQQAFYVAETGLLEGEKWILDNYLGHWMTGAAPTAASALGAAPTEPPAEVAIYNANVEAYTDAVANYHNHSNNYYRHTFDRGPARNDFTVKAENKTECMKSFKNIKATDDILIAGGGDLPKSNNFINIVGPLLLTNTPYTSPKNESWRTSLVVEGQEDYAYEKDIDELIEREVKYLRRFAYEFFVINAGAAAYRAEGSSIATSTSNIDTQGTAYRIYSCGIYYGRGNDDKINDGNIQIMIPLENLVVMPN